MLILDHNQLECYVTVCKSIVNESELALLLNLQKVSVSFSTLIYNPPDHVELNEFTNIWNKVVITLQKDPKLTDHLVCDYVTSAYC